MPELKVDPARFGGVKMTLVALVSILMLVGATFVLAMFGSEPNNCFHMHCYLLRQEAPIAPDGMPNSGWGWIYAVPLAVVFLVWGCRKVRCAVRGVWN